MLAFFAQMTAQKEDWQTMLYQPPTEAEEVLEALVNRRNQLVDMRTEVSAFAAVAVGNEAV